MKSLTKIGQREVEMFNKIVSETIREPIYCPTCGAQWNTVRQEIDLNVTGSRYVVQCRVCRKPSPPQLR